MKRILPMLLVLTFAPSVLIAEGMLYQLPPDGHWVRFELKAKGTEPDGQEVALEGTVTLRSVGTAKVDGVQCRWIEVETDAKRAGERFTDVDKLLIPETHLALRKEPLKNVVKAWHKNSAIPQVRAIDVKTEGPRYFKKLEPVLHGPYKKATKLPPVEINSKLGKLKCNGISATETLTQGGGVEIESVYTIRVHRKAPFGVVQFDVKAEVQREGQTLGTMRMKMMVVAAGKNAKSALPDQK